MVECGSVVIPRRKAHHMNTDYTLTIPPIGGTESADERDERESLDYGCECELDFRCGACGPGPSPIERINDEWAKREGCPEWAQ